MVETTRKAGGVRTLKHRTLKRKTVPRKTVVKKPATLAKKTVQKFSTVKSVLKFKDLDNKTLYDQIRRKLISIRTTPPKTFDGLDIDNHPVFDPLSNIIGDENVLSNFTGFLGRDDVEIYNKSTGGRSIRIPISEIPVDFCGLAFDGTHWKGYEPVRPDGTRIVYDSYKYELQLDGTMNFCQSYAAFLWSNHGKLTCKKYPNIIFVKGDFAKNIQKMAFLWIKWIEYIYEDQGDIKWLEKLISEGSGDSTFDIAHLYTVMKILSEDPKEAHAYAISI